MSSALSGSDLVGFLLLVMGVFIFFLIEKNGFHGTMIAYALASVLCFGFYSVLAKVIFEESSFITGFVWIKIGAALCALLSLLAPKIRKNVLQASFERSGSYRVAYAANVLYAGIGSVLVHFAISLAHPALVDSTQSFKYVVVFIAAWFLLRERFYGKVLIGKMVATVLIVLGLAWLGLLTYARSISVDMHRPITWGVTFSSKFSKELGLDWQRNFEAILQDLKPKRVRVIAYWDESEKEKGRFDFTDLDWQFAKMRETKTEAILAVGMRVPRWPECHIPEWALTLSPEEREAALRAYLQIVIERYRAHPEITLWQLENEPFLWFGLCSARGRDFFKKELDVFRSLLPASKVLVSDSGEFGTWYSAVKSGDVFGTTMYRKVYPPSVGHITGFDEYYLWGAEWWYFLKEKHNDARYWEMMLELMGN